MYLNSTSCNIETGFKLPVFVLFLGHVDAGKSTLMGHLLYRLGDVSKKSMHKYPLTIILY